MVVTVFRSGSRRARVQCVKGPEDLVFCFDVAGLGIRI